MKSFISFLLAALSCLPVIAQDRAGVAFHGEAGWKMAILSDIHVMAPELLQEDGPAFQDYVAHDRKMLKESPELLKACVEEVLREHPQVVLVTGDLTKDGESVSHRYVAQQLLKPLRDANIPVYVIPGNHDVNNPHAVVFLKDTVKRTATVSPQEFAECYRDYGYGQALARDAYSLSYVVQLNDSTRLLAIDACKYEENDYDLNTCVTGGRIKPATMDFIRRQVADAEAHGFRVLTMMHHGLIRHWKWQDRVMGDYLIDDWKKYAKVFADLHLNIVFTGHFHAQDIVSRGKGERTVYDIETGSTVSYPMPYRLIRFQGKQMHITTKYIRHIAAYPSAEALEKRATDFAEAGIATIVAEMLPKKVPSDVARQGGEALGKAYVAHLAGDECMPADYPALLKAACKRLRPYSWKYAFALKKLGKYFYTDLTPADNELTIMTNYRY